MARDPLVSRSRRRLLQGLGAGLAVSITHLGAPRWVGASDLSLSDRIDLLYSNQFHFNRRGEPQITVGLMQDQREVVVSAPGGLDVLPSGDGGTRIEAGTRLRVRLVEGHAAVQRYTVVLESLPASNVRGLGPAAERWQARGLVPAEHEVGTVFGVEGKVLDTRSVLLTTGDFASPAAARKEAEVLVRDHRALGQLHPRVSARGHGRIMVEDLDRGTTIHADGVLWFSPRGDGPITVHDVLADTTMGSQRRVDRQYWGSVYVAVDRHGTLAVVNLVSETELLAGLVPAEIYASAPHHALRAQAVAARGQLVSKVGTRHLDDPFLLCAHQHCQVYAGKGHEHPRTTKAVRDTAGRVLMRPGGSQLVDTVYSANCGGHSEDNDEVWPSPPDPQLRGRPDPLLPARFSDGLRKGDLSAWLREPPRSYSLPEDDAGRQGYRWTATVDPAEIAGRQGVPADLGPIAAMEVLARGRSGRATTLRLRGSSGAYELHGELRIRRALGGLKSSMFLVEKDRDRYGRFQLVGGGHGHGVGLCQHGAMGMARQGKDVDEILAHYYQGSTLEHLW
ncbi:SpoIID/LytB domain-containing protein [Paraliomyxa miuraensis]|uniref:SpoIID/LytB domain-containing protein n=1 Tax=Paraliomyxa miuraensis TaxID=376150 RepID=UPI00225C20FC|nr:SpoIID/LytB domain-containing protein [Paraliomyxa miuraensis]MCX4244950.1 SpoIID/LytB domain-containing protein [Paraliomyxa miuraensis]